MSFCSRTYANEPIIDESNFHIYAPPQDEKVVIDGEEFGRGLELPPPEEKERQRAANNGFMKPFDVPTMSREEIRDRIKEREQRGKILSEIAKEKQVPTSNQNGTNFCWTYGVITVLNVMRAYRNRKYVEFSRESVAAPIKGYRNNGGWGDQALAYLVSTGIMPQSLWPQHHLRNAQYNTPENLAIAAQYKVTEFLILQDRNFLQMMTALLLDMAVAVGYNWWSHEVGGIDPVIIGSTDLGLRIWNSWGDSYGANGFAILAESKATADDAVIPVVQNMAA